MSETQAEAGEERERNVPEQAGDFEEVDAVPVLPEPRRERMPALQAAITRPLAELRATPGVQAAAVAAGGFVAGAAVVGLARRRAAPSGRRLGRRRGREQGLPIVASRSLLVDLHLLAPGRSR